MFCIICCIIRLNLFVFNLQYKGKLCTDCRDVLGVLAVFPHTKCGFNLLISRNFALCLCYLKLLDFNLSMYHNYFIFISFDLKQITIVITYVSSWYSPFKVVKKILQVSFQIHVRRIILGVKSSWHVVIMQYWRNRSW